MLIRLHTRLPDRKTNECGTLFGCWATGQGVRDLHGARLGEAAAAEAALRPATQLRPLLLPRLHPHVARPGQAVREQDHPVREREIQPLPLFLLLRRRRSHLNYSLIVISIDMARGYRDLSSIYILSSFIYILSSSIYILSSFFYLLSKFYLPTYLSIYLSIYPSVLV